MKRFKLNKSRNRNISLLLLVPFIYIPSIFIMFLFIAPHLVTYPSVVFFFYIFPIPFILLLGFLIFPSYVEVNSEDIKISALLDTLVIKIDEIIEVEQSSSFIHGSDTCIGLSLRPKKNSYFDKRGKVIIFNDKQQADTFLKHLPTNKIINEKKNEA